MKKIEGFNSSGLNDCYLGYTGDVWCVLAGLQEFTVWREGWPELRSSGLRPGHRTPPRAHNVNLVLLKPLILKYARCPGRNNEALEIKYASRGLLFLGGSVVLESNHTFQPIPPSPDP